MGKTKKPKYMTEYEHELTLTAARYAIGRSTISSQSLAKDMAKYAYNRMTEDQSIFFATDIKKQINEKLSMMPFNFSMSFDVNTSNTDYLPLDKFVEWMDDNNIEHSHDLNIWESIEYKGNNRFEATQRDVPSEYSSTSFDDLLVWNHLAKLMDYRTHKFAIIINNEGNKELVEYFEDYFKASYKKLSYVKEKIAISDYVANPYVIPCTIKSDNSNIVKDNLTEKEVKEWKINHLEIEK